MPGRYTLTASKEEIEKAFSASFSDEHRPRYNISPTQKVAAILGDEPGRIGFYRWGYKTAFLKQPLVNIRAETIDTSKVFSKAFRERRCVVIADSYYVWKHEKEEKIPYRVMMKDGSLFCFAGIWISHEEDIWMGTITTEPNTLIRKVHHRMPAILGIEDFSKWLGVADKSLLRPYPPGSMKIYRVNTDVNSSRHDRKEMIEAAQSGQ